MTDCAPESRPDPTRPDQTRSLLHLTPGLEITHCPASTTDRADSAADEIHSSIFKAHAASRGDDHQEHAMNATSAPHEQADAWNRANPIGTRVTAYPGTNRITSARIATRTRSTAWVVGDHTAVAAVVGYPGGIALTHLDVVTSNEAIDVAHLEQQRAWSRATFGSGPRTLGVLEHIRKELAEIEAAPADVEEWVDVIILALDGAWRAGWEPQQIIDAIKAKQAKNEARTWPDWRTMSEDQPIEHVQAGR